MKEELSQLVSSDPNYKGLLQAVLENPFIEKEDLSKKINLDLETLTKLLTALEEKMVILELASQSDRALESRVPKKTYMINPEVEKDIGELI